MLFQCQNAFMTTQTSECAKIWDIEFKTALKSNKPSKETGGIVQVVK